MPAVLADDVCESWLDPQRDPEGIVELIKSRPVPGELEHYPVRTLVNSSKAEGPELVEAVQ